MKKSIFAAVALAAMTFAGAASAVTLGPGNVTATNGVADGAATPGSRTDLDNAIDGDASTFFSLGLGGSLTVDISPLELASPATVLEVTFNSPNPGFPESARVFFGSTLAGEIFNQDTGSGLFVAESGFTFAAVAGSGGTAFEIGFGALGPFSTLTIVDTTFVNFAAHYNNNPSRSDGFDIGEVAVNAVPVPAALPLFASAIVGFYLLGRRRKSAA